MEGFKWKNSQTLDLDPVILIGGCIRSWIAHDTSLLVIYKGGRLKVVTYINQWFTNAAIVGRLSLLID